MAAMGDGEWGGGGAAGAVNVPRKSGNRQDTAGNEMSEHTSVRLGD